MLTLGGGMGSRGDREVAHPQPSGMPVPPTAGPAVAVTPAGDGGSKGDDDSSSFHLSDDDESDDLAELVKHEEKRQNEMKAAGAKSKSASKD